MRSYALAALLASSAFAAPRPQGLDFAAIDEAGVIPEPSIPVVDAEAATTVVDYEPTAAAASVSAAVQAGPTDTVIEKRAVDNSGCTVQPAEDDTSDIFLANTEFSDAALAASTPAGYSKSFEDLKGSNNAMGYMGYSLLKTGYDTETCASRCNAITGCSAFNVYYERDPGKPESPYLSSTSIR